MPRPRRILLSIPFSSESRSMKTVSCVVASLLAMAAAGMPGPSSAQSVPEYRVTQTVALGAPDRWDYVVYDADSGRVFVAHGNELAVVDGTTGAIAGHVKGLPGGTHGIAVVKDSNRGYTDEGE